MRHYIAALVFLAACSSAPGPAGPPGPQGEVGPAGAPADAAMIAALSAKVAALETEVAAVKPVKVPHYVVAETGEDLGRLVAPGSVWNEAMGAEVSTGATVTVLYAGRDCTGAAYAQWDRSQPLWQLRAGPSGNLYRLMSLRPAYVDVASSKALNGNCGNRLEPGPAETAPFVDTGTPWNTYRIDSLTVEMR